MIRTLAFACVLAVCSIARAQSLDAECTASFPARLVDAKQALRQYMDYEAAYEKARPAIEWFNEHCRFLSELEIAIRKLDDENAFVCDPKAKRRPKGLTSELVVQFGGVGPSIGVYQELSADNNQCIELDRAARVPLVISTEDDLAGVGQRLLVLCYGDEKPSCVKARAAIEAARAKGKL